jgi:hypothetical protein
MKFGEAIEEARSGKKICRCGWNGKNMFVAYMSGYTIAEENVNGRTKEFVPTGDLRVLPYFAMKTACGGWLPGWLASQTDMLADDWQVFEF